jgi:hypothetical protein
VVSTRRFLVETDRPSGVNAALGSRQWHEDQIVKFDVVARSERVVEITLVHHEAPPFRIVDSSPAPGITVAQGETPSKAYLVANTPFSADAADDSGVLSFNGTAIAPSAISLDEAQYTLEVDLSALDYSSNGTKTIIAENLTDWQGNGLKEGYDLSWQVEQFTNIQAGLRRPPTADGRTGVLRVARIVVDHDSRAHVMYKDWLNHHYLTETNVVEKIHVEGPGAATRLYILYFATLVPTVVRMFPSSGSVMSQDTVPDKIILGMSAPLNDDILTDPEVVLVDGAPATGLMTLEGNNQTLEIDTATIGTAGHHTIQIQGLQSTNGLIRATPLISTYSFSTEIPEGGGTGEAVDHGTLAGLDDDDHTGYLLADGSRAVDSGEVLGFGGLTSNEVSLLGSGTELVVRLGDNSARGNFGALGIAASNDVQAGAAYRFFWTGRTKMLAPSDGGLLITDQAEADIGLIQLGGTTSLYPALERTGQRINVRLADDSAYANMAGLDPVAAQDFVTLNYLGGLPPEEQFLMIDGSNEMDQGAAISFETGVQLSSPTPDALLITSQGGTGDPQIKIGGTTSSYPMIERSGGNLYFRKADESAYTTLVALNYNSVNGYFNWNASTEMSAPADGQLLLTNDAASDFDRLMFGGITSSYPSLKRNGTELQMRLADDSAYTNFRVASLIASNDVYIEDLIRFYETTAPAGAAGMAKMYAENVGGATALMVEMESGEPAQLAYMGGSRINYSTDGNLLLTNNAGTTFDLLQLGGTGAGDPALKYDAAGLYIYKADNSGRNNLYASLISASEDVVVGATKQFRWDSSTEISAPADGDLLLTDTAGTTFDRVMWGGTTSSYPSLARNGAGLMFRLADDSDYTSVSMGTISSYHATDGNKIEISGANKRMQLGLGAWIGWGPNPVAGSTDTYLIRGGVSQLLLSDSYTGSGDFDRLQFGGTTSAYPAWKRNGANFEAKTADDGGYANVSCFALLGQGSVRAGSAYQFYWPSKSEMTSPVDGQILFTDDAGTDFDRLMLGGTTSSYPAIQRSTSGISIRKADDSAYSFLYCSSVTIPDTTAGYYDFIEQSSPPGNTNTNYARFYAQDNGSGKTQIMAAFQTGADILIAEQESDGYFLLGGASGGQTAYGGTAASEDLTLGSTAHATKGQIFFGTHGAYYENNGRFNFGAQTSPSSVVEIGGDRTLGFVGGNSIVKASTAGARLTLQSNASGDSHLNFLANYIRFNNEDLGGTMNLQNITGGNRISMVVREGIGQTASLAVFEDSGGSDLLVITNEGVVDSKVTTGTAPFQVDSTTVVTDLNADTVDGYDASDLVPLAAKGDIYTTTGVTIADVTPLNVSVNDYQALSSDSTAATGLAWKDVSAVLDRHNGSTHSNSTTETSVFDVTFPASAGGEQKMFRITAVGNYKNNSGSSRTFTMKLKLDGTTIYSDESPSISTGAGIAPWNMTWYIAQETSSAQYNSGQFNMGTQGGADTGEGDASSTSVLMNLPFGNSSQGTINFQNDVTGEMTIQHSFADGNISWITHKATLEVL